MYVGRIYILDFRIANCFDLVFIRLSLSFNQNTNNKNNNKNWIQAFIKGRRQRVRVGRSPSPWSDVLSGIPQGSVLGPLFFVIYINDFPLSLKNSALLFADDTKIYTTINQHNLQFTLQEDIDKCVQWSQYGLAVTI